MDNLVKLLPYVFLHIYSCCDPYSLEGRYGIIKSSNVDIGCAACMYSHYQSKCSVQTHICILMCATVSFAIAVLKLIFLYMCIRQCPERWRI